jgi:hypothetical protein
MAARRSSTVCCIRCSSPTARVVRVQCNCSSCVTAHTPGSRTYSHGQGQWFGRFPSRQFAINAAWLELALVGIDLLAWTASSFLTACTPWPGRRSCATGCCVAARLVHTARRTILRIARTWPWAHELAAAYARLAAPGRSVDPGPGTVYKGRSSKPDTDWHLSRACLTDSRNASKLKINDRSTGALSNEQG